MGMMLGLVGNGPACAAEPPPMLRAALEGATHEVAVFAYFNDGGRMIGSRRLTCGMPGLITLPVRRIVREALLLDAEQLLMAHNHPSGEARPSRADIEATRRLGRALALFDIRLVDHWIVTHDRAISLRAMGLM